MPEDDEKKPEAITVEITRRILTRDPEVHGFFVDVEKPAKPNVQKLAEVWHEGFGSDAEASAFLRGLQTMARMLGRYDIRIPGMPGPDEAKSQ